MMVSSLITRTHRKGRGEEETHTAHSKPQHRAWNVIKYEFTSIFVHILNCKSMCIFPVVKLQLALLSLQSVIFPLLALLICYLMLRIDDVVLSSVSFNLSIKQRKCNQNYTYFITLRWKIDCPMSSAHQFELHRDKVYV